MEQKNAIEIIEVRKISLRLNRSLSLKGFSTKRQLNQAIIKAVIHRITNKKSDTSPKNLYLAKAKTG